MNAPDGYDIVNQSLWAKALLEIKAGSTGNLHAMLDGKSADALKLFFGLKRKEKEEK